MSRHHSHVGRLAGRLLLAAVEFAGALAAAAIFGACGAFLIINFL